MQVTNNIASLAKPKRKGILSLIFSRFFIIVLLILLELASAPGGFDEALCRECGLTLLRAPGLPGKCAPKAAGEAIAGAVMRILETGVVK